MNHLCFYWACLEQYYRETTLTQLAVLSGLTSGQDKARFGNLIGVHEEKIKKLPADYIEKSIRERQYVTGLRTPLEAGRSGRVGT